MTIEVAEPKVYLMSKTQMVIEELDENKNTIPTLHEFLEAEGCNAETDLCDRLGNYHLGEIESTELDMIPEVAGRACYGSYGRKKDTNERYLQHIIDVGHGSVLEHSTVGLMFTGVSRSFTHELVRHRLFGYSQRSQRFVDESSFSVAMPPIYKGEGWEEAHALVLKASQEALDNYSKLVELGFDKLSTPEMLIDFAEREGYLTPYLRPFNGMTSYHAKEGGMTGGEFLYTEDGAQDKFGDTKNEAGEVISKHVDAINGTKVWWVAQITHDKIVHKRFQKATATARRKTAREAARSVLPNATETKIYTSGNLRAWRGMLDQRASIHAAREIRGIAMEVLKIMKLVAPNVFADYEVKTDSQGIEFATTPNRKV